MYSRTVAHIACLLIGFCLGLSNQPCEAAKRRFTVPEDIALIHFGDPYTGKAHAVTVSPDGQYFVVDTERGRLDLNRPESTLRVFRTDNVRQFLLHPKITRQPSPVWMLSKSTYKDGPIISDIRWLANSRALAFLVKTALGNDQLILADLEKGTIHALTPKDEHVTSFDIRDREHYIYSILSRAIRRKAIADNQATAIVGTGHSLFSLVFSTDLPFISKLYDLSELWAVNGLRRFRVDDSATGRPFPLYSEGQQALALSPDGNSVVTARAVDVVPSEWQALYPPPLPSDAYRIRPGRQELEAFDGRQYVSEYVWIDLRSGTVKPLAGAPTGKSAGWWSGGTAAWSSDGQSVVLPNTFLRPSDRGSDNQRTRPCVAAVDLTNGHITCLERLRGKTDDSQLDDGYRYIDAVRFVRGSSAEIIVQFYGSDSSKGSTRYVRSNDGKWTLAGTSSGWPSAGPELELDVRESFKDPPVLVATDKTTKISRVIWDPNPYLKDIDLGDASIYKWKDKRGREWRGGLYKPPEYIEGRRYPLVIQTHGFFEMLFRPSGLFPTAFAARELAAAGIMVLQVPDCPITIDPDEGSCNAAGYDAAVQQLTEEGLADPDRVGIVGFSRTCYYVLEALTSSERHFKAATLTDGVNFGYLQYITAIDLVGNGFSHEAVAVIGARPFGEGLQQWLKRSPGFNMDKVNTPLQLVANGRPSLIGMWEPYAALRDLNKPVDLIVLAEGTHVLTNPAGRMVSQGGTVDWFRFWLKGEEDPDPAKAEQYARWRGLRKQHEENLKKPADAPKRD